MCKYLKFQLHIITVKQVLLGRVQVLDSAFSIVERRFFMGRIILAILGVATVIVEEILKDD